MDKDYNLKIVMGLGTAFVAIPLLIPLILDLINVSVGVFIEAIYVVIFSSIPFGLLLLFHYITNHASGKNDHISIIFAFIPALFLELLFLGVMTNSALNPNGDGQACLLYVFIPIYIVIAQSIGYGLGVLIEDANRTHKEHSKQNQKDQLP